MPNRTPDHFVQRRLPAPFRHVMTAALVAILWVGLLLSASVILKQTTNGMTGNLTLAITAPSDPPMTTQSGSHDQCLRQQIVGTWSNFHHGERTMIVRGDGTATMIVLFRGIKARLFTRRLELEMVWSVQDGCMTRRTVGGTPADKIVVVNRYAGQEVTESILNLTDDQLVLLDTDGTSRHQWQRVAAAPAADH
jgi:hypothetical protein